jgi:23S rRNA A2030 N6-methylase RlmJ
MYDHSQKIGNKGDLIKHFALTVAVREMAAARRSFSYLDVHSGRGAYRLPEGGEWEKGLGVFAERCNNQGFPVADLRYFNDLHGIGGISQSRQYCGSSSIVRNVLEDLGVNKRKLVLCDTNPEVCRDLEAEFSNSASVQICCVNGYEKAQEVTGLDLVFIDPPDIREHYMPFMRLLRHCRTEGQPFISWNPLHGNVQANTMSRNCAAVTHFAEEASIPSIAVRWAKGWSRQMCGCQMLFSVPVGQRVADACEALITFMDWQRIQSQGES